MDTFKIPEVIPPKEKKEYAPPREKPENEAASNAPTIIKSESGDANIPYTEPKWSRKPPSESVYKFEVLKSGQIIQEHNNLQNKAYWIFGRFPQNDIVLEHPTISRYHSVLQYRPKNEIEEGEDTTSPEEGWYIYDLGSTHGTFINKQRVPPKVYIRIKVGHMLTLGLSTRKLIFYGPEEDEEPESELTVTELKERRQQEIVAQKEREKIQQEEREKEGISWGMSEDAEEESDLSVNPYATTTNEELFLDDPKKTLRGYFEREGYDLEYKCDEISAGTFVCKIELPLDDGNGRPIVAEVTHKGRKKECALQCALEACRILDRHGVLRQSHHEPQKRRANEFKDDSDDDEFYDRTSITKEKKQRLSNPKEEKTVLSNDNLQSELDKIVEKIKGIDKEIADYNERYKAYKENKEKLNEGDLDDFMNNLNADVADFDTNQIRVLRKQKFECLEQKKFFERAIKKTAGPNLLNKFGIKKPKPAAPVRLPEPKVDYEFKPEEESDEEDETAKTKLIAETEPDIKDTVDSKPSSPKSLKIDEAPEKTSNIEENECLQKSEPSASDDYSMKVDKLEMEPQRTDYLEDIKATESHPESKSSAEKPSPSQPIPAAPTHKKHSKIKKSKSSKGIRTEIDIDDVNERDDQYVGWVPPKNQSGDGRSSLNEKYGY